jgi:CheY-like chemotaxis protein
MFAQVGDSLSRAQGGLGIGLSLSRRLVELHGGTITLDSSSPAGSTFLIRLPLAAGAPALVQPAAPAVQAPAAPPAPRAGGPLSVLVVDDNIDAADMLAGIIEVIGHRCVVAHNGAEALRQAPAVRPDLVFLDIGMPGMTGYEVARTLREMQLAPRPLIVAVTGWGDDKDRQRTSEAASTGT